MARQSMAVGVSPVYINGSNQNKSAMTAGSVYQGEKSQNTTPPPKSFGVIIS